MKTQIFLTAGLSLYLVGAIAENAPPLDAPIEIEGWDTASERAQAALKQYYAARRNQPKQVSGVIIAPATRVGGASEDILLPKMPGSEEPEQVSTVKDLQIRQGGPTPPISNWRFSPEAFDEEPDSKSNSDFNTMGGYYINRGGGLQFFGGGRTTRGAGNLNMRQVERSQIDRISPHRSLARLKEGRTQSPGKSARTIPRNSASRSTR